ncbi:uncharacterized protein V1510DRAFT_391090 [Dipodascopsis tothii]|uniref:uncharacterized protein n=1 Tax=Dipodascopsis tothii TaxID=44089 RepID=UPI0034CD94C8
MTDTEKESVPVETAATEDRPAKRTKVDDGEAAPAAAPAAATEPAAAPAAATEPAPPPAEQPAETAPAAESAPVDARDRGMTKIKAEYLVQRQPDKRDADGESKPEEKKKHVRGQNKGRRFLHAREQVQFCEALKQLSGTCPFGAQCRYEHDPAKYLAAQPAHIEGPCPVYEAIGYCPSGIKCRWLFSHYADGKLLADEAKQAAAGTELNRMSKQQLSDLQKRKFPLPRSAKIIPYLDSLRGAGDEDEAEARREAAAEYVEAPYTVAEKKRIDLRGAKILSPLTTVGNLPFRLLCRSYGCEVTYSEMAVTLPLLQGSKSEWALQRSNTREFEGRGYFGSQISAAKPWQAVKTAEALAEMCGPNLGEINLNCGCPIDLIYRAGAGSALLDSGAKLMRILKGMNAASGEIPVTAKIRMGTRDNHPNAKKLVTRMMREGDVAAITLHGRSRQQRYTRSADWGYIGETAALVRELNVERTEADTAAGKESADRAPVWFVGNGDCYSWKDWWDAVDNHGVDSVMIARGALIKPWIFEEIDKRDYIDKSATERLDMIKQFAGLGLAHWGSDEYGVNTTRRFLCELLSFTHRYVPVGLLEVLPPRIQDRPPLWRGRNELETLLGSGDYRDWVKISEMFLGPAHESFNFVPKHRSNAYDAEG